MKYEIEGHIIESDNPLSEPEIDEIGQKFKTSEQPSLSLPQNASLGGFGANILSSLGKTALGAVNPINYGEQIYQGAYQLPKDITQSLAQKVGETVTGQQPTITPIEKDVQQQIVNQPLVQNPIKEAYENPVGTAATLATPVLAFHPALSNVMGDSLDTVTNASKTFLGKLNDIGAQIKGSLKEPPTQIEIETGVQNLQNALVQARQDIGQKLQAVRNLSDEPLSPLEQKAILKQKTEALASGETPKNTPQSLAKEFLNYENILEELKKSAPTPDETQLMKAPEMEGKGLEGPLPNIEDLKGQLGVGDVTAYVKGIQKGLPSKGIPDIPIYGVKGPASLLKNLFGDEAPASVPENVIRDKGIPIEGETVIEPPELTPTQQTQINNAQLKYLMDFKQRLSQAIKNPVPNVDGTVRPISTEEQGLLKSYINNVNDKIENIPGGDKIRATEKEFSNIAGIYDDLQSKLSEPGKAESFLRKVFTSDNPMYKDYRNKLGTLENISNQPVLTNLFDLFKRESQQLTYEQFKHPVANITQAVLPQIGNVIRALPTTAQAAGTAGFPLAATAPSSYSQLQSLRDRLLNANQ